jgi:hypothetical protein
MAAGRGEITALYASGGLALEDAVRAIIDCAIHKPIETDWTPIQNNHSSPYDLSKEGLVSVTPIYESGNCDVSALPETEYKVLGYYFNSKVSSSDDEEHSIYYSKSVQPLPLHTDLYSTALGRYMPAKTNIPNNYWLSICPDPIQFHPLQAINELQSMDVVINIGPQTISKEQSIQCTGNCNVEVLESINSTQSEIELLQRLQRRFV